MNRRDKSSRQRFCFIRCGSMKFISLDKAKPISRSSEGHEARHTGLIAAMLLRGLAWIIILMCSITTFAQRPTSLRGQVADQFGAVVVGVTVTVTGGGKTTTAQS